MESTVQFKGVEFTIDYDYQPYEKEVRYDSNMEGYPGCAEQIDIILITFQGENFTEILEDNFTEIEELISNQLKE